MIILVELIKNPHKLLVGDVLTLFCQDHSPLIDEKIKEILLQVRKSLILLVDLLQQFEVIDLILTKEKIESIGMAHEDVCVSFNEFFVKQFEQLFLLSFGETDTVL